MGYLFLIFLFSIICFLCYKENFGALLCLLTLFPEIVGLILNHAGLMGLNMASKYVIFALIIWLGRKTIDVNYRNVWRNYLSVLFYILVGVVVLHNECIVKGALQNPEIAAFQQNIILRIMIPYVILMLVADRVDVLNDYCRSIPWWGLFFMIIFVLLKDISSIDFSNRMTIEDETGINSISLSRFSAITLLSSIIFYLRCEYSVKKYAYLGILVFSTFTLLLASQRGTIIGVIVASLFALGLILIRKGKTLQFLGITIGIVSIVTLILTFFDFEILSRFQELEKYQTFKRYTDYGIAWRAFSENNYLSGLGSMGYSIYTGGGRPYPHNLVLELMSEYGLIGLIYAILLIIGGGVMVYRILFKTKKISPLMVIPIIWIGLLFSVLVSGSIITNAPFFLITGVLILIDQNPEEFFLT